MSNVWGSRRGEVTNRLRDWTAFVEELGLDEQVLPFPLIRAVKLGKRSGDFETLDAAFSEARRFMVREFLRRERSGS